MSINYTYLDSTAGKGGKAYTEITVGATGLKQKAGGKKKKKRKSLTPEAPVASPSPTGPLPLPPFSRLCRRELLRLAQEISPPPLSSSPSNYQQGEEERGAKAACCLMLFYTMKTNPPYSSLRSPRFAPRAHRSQEVANSILIPFEKGRRHGNP